MATKVPGPIKAHVQANNFLNAQFLQNCNKNGIKRCWHILGINQIFPPSRIPFDGYPSFDFPKVPSWALLSPCAPNKAHLQNVVLGRELINFLKLFVFEIL